MFSIARVFIAFHAAAYLALVGLAPALSLALAKPFPMPMMMARNHSTSLDEPEAGPRSKTTKTPFNSSSLHSKPASPAPRTLLPFFMRSVYPRQDDGISELVLALGPYMTAANNHADTLHTCSSSCLDAPADQQQSSVDTLLGFSGDLKDMQSCFLGYTGDDKGLGNYNKNSELETLLKNLINLIKEVLAYVNNLIECISLLKVLLEPAVYDIKCIIEYLLDFCENVTDALLNDLVPSLQALLADCEKLLNLCSL